MIKEIKIVKINIILNNKKKYNKNIKLYYFIKIKKMQRIKQLKVGKILV